MMNASRRPVEKYPNELIAHLRALAATRPTDTALIVAAAEVETKLTYAELDRRVRAVAAEMQRRFEPGDRALLLLDNNEHYVVGFLACLYAGLIAVPAFPPESLREHHVARLTMIANDAQARCVVVSSDLLKIVGGADRLFKGMDRLVVDEASSGDANRWLPRVCGERDVVFLQYTSGSTAAPKGVIVTQGNLLANEHAISQALQMERSDVFVSWLPLFHDMGLVGGLFQPIYSGIPLVLMSPGYFLERPARWLELISRHRGTISGGPDFAYRLCLERITDAQIKKLDLSTWRVAFSGAEPVRHDTLQAFAERFKDAGFNPRAIYPCYGLAEATLLVTGGQRDSGMTVRTYSSERLAKGRAVTGKIGTSLVACGVPHSGHRVRIADPETGVRQPNTHVGEIWVSGPSVSPGYWRREEETAETFVERDGRRWLRTGDLGFVQHKQLYITGRRKDLIILRGHNVYPQDIERQIESEIEAVRKGRVAVFAVETELGEGIGVAAEVSRGLQKLISPERLFAELSQVVSAQCNEPLSVAVLLNPGGLPKTSSGKVQRAACRIGWQEGTLDAYATLQNGVSRPESRGVADVEAAGPLLTPAQRRIGAIWAEILRVPEPAVATADFFALGGNSIMAAQVTARVSAEFSVRLEPAALLGARTISAFTELVEQAPRQQAPTIGRVARAEQLQPSAAQRRMWFLWQLEPDNAAYNVGGGLRLRGELDVAVLQRTVDELVRRHEVLRTRFQQLDGVLTQHLDDLRSVAIDTVDLSGEPAEARGGRIDTLLSTEFQRPFDLQRAPVLRVALLKLDALEHVLFVTTHHIAADGMSMVLLMEDLVRIYGALRKGQTPDERQLAVQYLDHAAWQEAEFEREGRERQLAYWTQRLGREYPDTSPRLDRPRPKWPDHRGERYRIPIDPSLMQGVRSLANAQGVTVFVVLLTAWKIVLARHSGHHDIRVGAPAANRRSVASESMVGPFVNTVVLRTGLDGNPGASELLRRVAQTVLEAQAHQELPFEQLVEALAADRTSSRHPLFQVMHNHQSRARTTFEELAPLQAEVLDGPQPITEFDLSLNTEEWDGQIRAALKYRTALYDESTVARIAGHWLNALQAMVAAPQSPLDEIQLLGPQEISRLLRAFNATTSHYADNVSSIHRLIERQVARSPDAEAVVFEGARCSYRELNRRANRLAWKLRGSGVGPDVLVGICSERCLDLAIGLLAILKAGGAYLPLDPAYPRSRLDFILDDSQPRVVLAGRDVLEKLPSTARSSAWLLDEEHSEQQRDDDLPGLTHPHNLAYCLYTSGSTGQPKCAANTHGALLNQMLWRQEVYGLREHDRVLHKTPIGFDVSVWEIFWPLMTGATLVLAAPGAHRDPWRLRAVIQNECVTTLHFVPPMLTAFIEAGELARCESLRRVFVGGQALAPATHAAFFQQCNAKLYNLYGPTEAAIDVTFWECNPETHESIIPMGRALANTQLYVLDHALAPVPVGVVGELYIAGAQLARGYAHRPGQTASKFLANPFTPGERMYRSGDLARYRPDGALEYVGRIDHQVKVRGFRIELEEIEARLREHPAVRDAVVLVVRDGFGESELVAHVVSSGVDSRFQQQLHDYLAQRLPDYMLPAHYAWLDALPLLSNGKVDRAALAAFKPVSARQVYAPPRTEIERRVAAIWDEVLEVENVGLHESFFELGGHSLLATRAVSKIRAAFDIELPLRTLFEATRLGDFAEAVRKCVDEGVRSPFGQIEPVDRSSPLPLSHAQQRMWLLWQLDPRSVAYNLAGKVKLTGPLNYAAIEDTLRTLSERHEALRTTFRVLDGVPGQNIAAHVDIPVEHIDLRALSDVDRHAAVARHADSEAHRPFDLQTGPLLRVLLLQLQDREHLMIVTTHHIVAEGWAIDVFAREFMALYQGFSTGRATVLSPLPVQYADYMHWHARWLAGGEQERQLKYWKNQLSGDHELLALPTDRPRPKVASTHGDVHRFVIEPTLAARLREFSTRHDLTLFMTLLAGFFALLHRYSRQSDINVGFPVANRVRPEAEGLIGAFLNMQVMRCRLSDATTFEQLLARIKEATIAGQSHQDVPFDRLVDAIKPPRGPGFHPLYQVMFNLHRWNFERRSQMGDVTIEVMPNDVRAAQLDLTLDVGDVGDGLECGVIYNTDLFDRATIERLSGYWIELLRAALERQDQRIGGIPLLSDSDRALLGACGVNDGGIFPGATSTEPVHRLFERQAEQRPNATALIVGADELSYAELNQRANRLAHRLIALGVKPEDCIGIAVERSADMLVGLLAVLKAGAAYVPLDPAHPLERIDYMIRDSGVSLLLTNSNVVERFSRHTACNTLLLDRPDWQDEPHRNPNVTLHSEHPAYTIYTSGSTGRPKGVQVRHGALGNFLLSMRDRPGFGADDRLVAVTSLSFDIAGLELYLPLIAGACVVLATEAEAHDGRLLAQLLEKHRATVLQATPSGWRLLLAAGWRGAGSAGLRALCGGEELQADLARQLRDMNVELWNMYGPTETTIWSSTGRVSDAAVSLGRPIAATQLHVLTGDLLPAAPGMPGELYIGGNGLARGYLRRAALSSERFIANPLSMNGERLYRTGDLVRWSAGGELQYLGRIDHQVKIRGFRIELAEIESRLLEQPEVREAVVAAKEGPVGARLVGYVSSNDGFAIEPSVLRDRIATLLPDYMVPSSLVVLERLPLNANGKVDRKALPAPDLSSYADEPPQGEIELTLARIWTDVLKVERVGRHDNFFEVGGDSILSLQIVTRAHSAGWKLAPKQLFEHRTIAALARVAERVEDCSSVEEMIRSDGPLLTLSQQQLEALPFSADQIEDVLPLTPMQEGMLLHTVLDPGSGMYLMQHRFTIESPIDQVAFWASWDAALHEHAALRAGFFWQAEAKPFQVIRREVDLPKQFLDLRELDQSAALSRIDAILSAELSAGFDMARAPLIGVRLAQLGTERFHVVVSFHHILMDAWCFALLVREVLAQYEFRTVGAQPPLQRPAPYRDFLVWLMRQDRAAALNHWRQVLAGIDEVTPLPMIRHVAAGSGGSRMVDLNTRLSAAQTAQLHAVASRYELTPNTLIQGAWALVLARYANSNDVVFGVTVAGKPAQLPDLERTVGLFINTIASRVVLPSPGDRVTVAQWLQTLFAQNTQAREFEHLPLTDIQASSGLSSQRRLFDSLFVFENAPVEAEVTRTAQRLLVTPHSVRTHTNYPVTIMIVPGAECLLQITYDERFLDAEVAERLLNSFRLVIEQFIAAPAMALEQIRVLTDTQRQAIVAVGVGRSVEQPLERGYIDLFQRQVARHPSSAAARCGELAICYEELDSRSSCIARVLVDQGVLAGETVVVFGERNLDYLTMVLACFKAGAAYLALDVGMPALRLARIVAISGARFVLAQNATLRALDQVLAAMPLDDPRPHVIDASNAQTLTTSRVFRPAPVHPGQPAYVIFTSGSTGEPKGVVVTQQGMLNNQLSKIDSFPLGPDDVIAQTASQSFDISVWQLLAGLLCGACVDIVTDDVARDPSALLDHVRHRGVTVLESVPSMMQGMLAFEAVPLPSLRVMMATGEAINRSLAQAWKDRYPEAALVNAYGPAECADDVALHFVPAKAAIAAAQGADHLFPIGRAIDNNRLCILDAQLEPVPVGVPGELYVAGIGIAQGYLARSALTSERFVADVFSDREGARMYRTGDVARLRPDGALEYLGRADHQVKVRGYRIELGEIEAQIARLGDVRAVAVGVQDDALGAPSLVAHVVLLQSSAADAFVAWREAAQARLREALPEYMIPTLWMPLDAMPLTPNGKVDRKALPRADAAQMQAVYEPPRSEVEQVLARVWEQVLAVERVGRHDNFFQLGGHSLLALSVIGRLRAEGFAAPVRMLFQHPQLAAFAQAIAQVEDHIEVAVPPNLIPPDCRAVQPDMLTLVDLDIDEIGIIERAVPGGAANIQDIYPLVPLQEGILFHHALQTQGDVYLLPHLIGFDSRERLERFITSLEVVIRRHDILRTAVLWEGLKEPVQVVYRAARLELEWLPDDGGQGALERLKSHVDPKRHRIDVSKAPMLRAVAARDGERWLLQLLSHHLVLDHETLERLVEEIALIQQGRAPELPEPIPFRRFVAQCRAGISQAEHEAFFRKMLCDVDEPTAPFGMVSVHADGNDIEEAHLRLDDELARQIRQQAQRRGVSAAALFHLAWAMVLSKLTGKDDVVFGTVLFGRMQGVEGAERALGMFNNTLPLRIKIGASSVEQCLSRTHEALTQLLRHEHASLSLVQRCSGLPAGTPLFSALLNYRYSGRDEIDANRRSWEGMEALGVEERTNYPIALSVADLGRGFELTAQIDGSIGPRRWCDYFRSALTELLAALSHRPERPACELDLLNAAERGQLMQWSVNNRHYAGAEPVHRCIERQTQVDPDATALIFGADSLTYGELNVRANQLAHRLITLGVGPEVRVGIAMERSLAMVVGLLAILKAGGAYVPLDPEYPAERLSYMLRDSGVGLLLTQSSLVSQLPMGNHVTVQVDALDLSGEAQSDPSVPLHADNLAYVIYTSGSTGKPKAAANRHGSLYNRLAWMQEAYELSAADTVLQKTPFSFDVSVWEFFWPLMQGARLAIAAPGAHRDPQKIVELICRHEVTTLHFVPSMLQAFMEHDSIAACATLRRIVCSGEALSAETQTKVFARLPWASLHNLYGPTEAAIDVTHWTCADDGRSSVPIGQPIAATRTVILDAELNLAASGVAGELYLGGAGLARGYLNRSGLSAERFIADPLSTRGERLYRTGDLVRWSNDGQLEYLGRIDHQVKIRGFRIELGEIESKLLAQPEVREAVVAAKPGSSGARLVGYVSATTGHSLDVSVLRERLAIELPDYMVPSALVVLERLPLNANGKVDRKALPEPEVTHGALDEPPQGEIEQALARIWADVLELDHVGRHDNFFELGGDSILNLRIVTRARGAGWKLSPGQLFEHKTVAALAQVAERIDEGKSDTVAPLDQAPLLTLSPAQIEALAFPAAEIEDVFPLTPMQEGMLLHTVLDPSSGMYLMQHRYTIESAIDVAVFWESWDSVVQEHAALRAGFYWQSETRPYQVVQRAVTLPKHFFDLRDLDPSAAMARIDAILREELATGFDMSKPPLMRIRLARLGERRFHLAISYHHILVDAWCFGLLVADVLAHYEARTTGTQIFRERPAHYREFIAWLMKQDRTAALDYWRRVLDGFDVVTPLPMLRPAPSGSSGSRMVDLNTTLSVDQTSRLLAAANLCQVTPNAMLEAAWALVLARHANTCDVLFGVTVAGKPAQLPRLENTVGLFINTIPTRVAVPNPEQRITVAQWLRSLFARSTQAREFEHLPLTDIQALSGLPQDRSLFDSLFVFENAPIETHAVQSAERLVVVSNGNRVHTNYPITVMIGPGREYLLQITYDARSLDAAPVERLLRSFKYVIEQFIAAPSTLLENIRVLTPAEQRGIVAQGAGPAREQRFDPGYVGLFKRAVASNPSRIAARHGELSLSYEELDASTDRLAHALRREGVTAGETVVVFCERNLDLLKMVLACFKVGAAYLAVDIGMPAQRVARIAAISGARFMLAHGESLAAPDAVPPGLKVVDIARVASSSAAFEPAAVHPDQPAYVIFTSGSTGDPKGVVVTSRGMLNNQLSKIDTFPLGPEDVIAQTASQSFDISVWQLLGGLLCGACVDIVANDVARDPGALLEHVRHRGVTVLESVPSMMQGMLALDAVPLPTLRVMMATGEAIGRPLAQAWKSRYPGAALINAYGPAECSDDVTLHVEPAGALIPEHDSTAGRLFPIGRAVDNNRLCVLDTRLEPVPAGVPGELYVAGIGVGQGYLARPDLTSDRFVADTFSGREGARMYRTGDVVRLRVDGAFEYLGRTDHQVKVRGYRIELGEIEAQIERIGEVRAAAVNVHEDPLGGPRLVGYVVSRESDAAVESGAWREKVQARLREVLPEYMIPTLWMSLHALPLTANGKVDRMALPRPDAAQFQAAYEPPESEVERILADIWAEVLGVERVGRRDNFFELGGHSLLALSVIGRLRAEGMAAPMRTLFQHPRLADFAQALSHDRDRTELTVPPNLIPSGCQAIQPDMLTLLALDSEQIRNIERAVPGGAANIQDIYPLVALQEGILFHHTLQSRGDVYILSHSLGFDSRQRLEQFVASLNIAIDRHDILRTAVLWEALQEPVQVVYRQARLDLEWLREDGGADALERLAAYVDPRRHRMDVRRAPMLRAVAVHDVKQQRWLLQLLSHHLVLDNETLERLIEEIALIQQGRASQLPEPIPFRRFVAQSRVGVSQAEHEAFFKRMLSDVDEPTAPFGLSEVHHGGDDIEEARFRVDDDLAERLRKQAQRQGVTAASIFHLAWALVLAKTTSSDDVVFGTVLFGRMQGVEGAERALGMFNNTLPVRIKLGFRSIEQCLKATHEMLTQLLHHEYAHLSLLQRCSSLPPGTPLFSALLNYRYNIRREADEAIKGWDGIQILTARTRNNFPITMSVDDLGQGFELTAYVSKLAGAQRVCEYLHRTLAEVVAALTYRADKRACELDVLGVAEYQQHLRWGANDAYLSIQSVPSLIHSQVLHGPAARAVVFDDSELSYEALAGRANSVARRLLASGVGAEVRVGLHAERSIEFVIGLLAIWKAGGVYVPLSPRLPADRLAYQLKDSGARILLSATPVEWAGDNPVVDLSVAHVEGGAVIELPEVHPLQSAYVIYTSGSTGRPKGVTVSHGALANYVRGVLETLALPDSVRSMAMASTTAADLGHTVLFGALCSGRTLHLISETCAFDPDRFAVYMREHQVDVLKIVPSHLRALLSAADSEAVLPGHSLILGGEATDWSLLDRVRSLAPECRVINHYGPTEMTVGALTQQASTASRDGGTLPIGGPLPNVQGYVLDGYLNPVTQGVVGELYLGGAGLARCYDGKGGLTAERFVASSFRDGERLYRTGDRARRLRDGSVEFLGRTDDQVKVRGYRVEINEIVDAIKARPGVHDAAVITRIAEDQRIRLHGYVVPRAGASIDVAELREHLATVLPEYMVPAALVAIDRLPLTANGKLDRKALPESGEQPADRYEAPQGELEEVLAGIWAEQLGVERVGRHDNFFVLGGDSILVLKVIARARRHSIAFVPKLLFQHQTLSLLARAIGAGGDAQADTRSQRMAAMDRLLEELEESRDAG